MACSRPGTADGPLFTKIPPEIRRDILISIFGGRTLHALDDQNPFVCRGYGQENNGPVYDTCNPKSLHTCKVYTDSIPPRFYRDADGVLKLSSRLPKWCINAMGWLLTCRQA